MTANKTPEERASEVHADAKISNGPSLVEALAAAYREADRLRETQAQLHASAPAGMKCADCTMDGEACPDCYAAWWRRRHPHTHVIGSQFERHTVVIWKDGSHRFIDGPTYEYENDPDWLVTVELNARAAPEASGDATGAEGNDSNMGTAPTSGPEATSLQGSEFDRVVREVKARNAAVPQEVIEAEIDEAVAAVRSGSYDNLTLAHRLRECWKRLDPTEVDDDPVAMLQASALLAEAAAALEKTHVVTESAYPDFIDIVFDGPPSHQSGRFVEVENHKGQGIGCGVWIDRGSGLYALRIAMGLREIPSAWMRWVRCGGHPAEPQEWDVELCYGDDRPEGEGWTPLYMRTRP